MRVADAAEHQPKPKPKPPGPKPINKCPTLYSESNYKGDSFEICKTLSYFPITFNKKVKSYLIGSVERVIFFTETLCSGEALEDNDDEPNMNNEKSEFVNNIKSALVDNWENHQLVVFGCIRMNAFLKVW